MPAKGKYTVALRDTIVLLRSETNYTIREICENVGISHETYHQWLKTKPDFSEAMNKAEAERIENIREKALSVLGEKLHGLEWEEETVEYEAAKDSEGNKIMVPAKRKVTKKFQPASDIITMYTLNNTVPEQFQHASQIRPAPPPEDGINLKELTTAELKERMKATIRLKAHTNGSNGK